MNQHATSTTDPAGSPDDHRDRARITTAARGLGVLAGLAVVLVAASACRPMTTAAGAPNGTGAPSAGPHILAPNVAPEAAKLKGLLGDVHPGQAQPTTPSTPTTPSDTAQPGPSNPTVAPLQTAQPQQQTQQATPPVDTNPYPNPVFTGASIYDPGVVSYQNPSGDGGWAYYVASGGGSGPVYSTLDRRTYTPAGNLLAALPGGVDHIGSPQIYQYPDGRWHAVFGVRWQDGDTHDCIGSATGGPVASSAPVNMTFDGNFMCDRTNSFGVIDPSVFTTDDGTQYLLYKDDLNEYDKPGRIMIRRMGPGGSLTAMGDSQELLTASADPSMTERGYSQASVEGNVVEAPEMIENNIGGTNYYFLFYSGGTYNRSTYNVDVARSTSPTGGFVRSPHNSLISTVGDPNACGAGGQTLTYTPGDGWLIWYHAYRTDARTSGSDCSQGKTQGRYLMMDQLHFDNGGWPYINDGNNNYPST